MADANDLLHAPWRSGGQRTVETALSYYDRQFGTRAAKILPGEFLVTDQDIMLVTLLGSCVCACIRDPLTGIGGLNHFMLPDCPDGRGDGGGAGESARYGGYAMEMLVNELLKRGARRARLQAKVFGGGSVLPGMCSNVGERNAAFVLEYLSTERIHVAASDLLGTEPRRVHYFPMSGRVMVLALPSAHRGEVLAGEQRYRARLQAEPASGSVELF